jgi:hypothetical protein
MQTSVAERAVGTEYDTTKPVVPEAPVIAEKKEPIPAQEAAPAVTPESVKPEGEQAAAEPTPGEEPAKPAEKTETHDERRWKRLVRERAEAQAEAAALRAQIARGPQPSANSDAGQQAEAPVVTDAQYVQQLVRQAVAEVLPQTAAPAIESEDKVREIAPDFDDVMDDAADVKVPDAVRDAMLGSSLLHHLRYALAKDPAKARSFYTMTPQRAAAEVGKMEARIEADLAIKRAPKQKPVSQAPAPIKSVLGGGSVTDVDESKLTDEEWFKRDRAKKLAASRNT